MKYFVTGGAGFIGSHFVDAVIDEHEVTVYDDFSSGHERYLPDDVEVVTGDVLHQAQLQDAMRGTDVVAHFQANADVKGGIENRSVDLEQNTLATHNVLEAMHENDVKNIIFSSSATVYGEPNTFPTPEDEQLIQTSLYGASKLAGEGLIEAYCEYFDMQSWIFRFTSFIGERYTHGVIYDFVNKLRNDPETLKILGNGQQRKAYLYVKDGIQAMLTAFNKADDRVNIYNLGHDETAPVDDMANTITDELGLDNVEYEYTGGKRGWKGDAPKVHLDTSKIKQLGWAPTVSIEEATRRTVQYLLDHPSLLA